MLELLSVHQNEVSEALIFDLALHLGNIQCAGLPISQGEVQRVAPIGHASFYRGATDVLVRRPLVITPKRDNPLGEYAEQSRQKLRSFSFRPAVGLEDRAQKLAHECKADQQVYDQAKARALFQTLLKFLVIGRSQETASA